MLNDILLWCITLKKRGVDTIHPEIASKYHKYKMAYNKLNSFFFRYTLF